MLELFREKIENNQKTYEIILSVTLFFLPISFFIDKGVLDKNIYINMIIFLAVLNIIKEGIKNSFYEKYLIGLVAIIIVSKIFENVQGVKSISYIFKEIILMMALPFILGQIKLKEKNIRDALIGLFLTFIYFFYNCFYSIVKEVKRISGIDISYYEIFKPEILDKTSGLRLFRAYESPIHIYYILGVATVFFYYFTFDKNRDKKIRVFSGFLLLLSIFFVILSQSRGMMVALGVTFILSRIICFIDHMKENGRDIKIKLLKFLTVVCVFWLGIISLPENNVYKNRILNITKEESSEPRRVVWKESLNLFKNDFLTGIGYENFPEAEKQIKNSYHYWGKYKHQHNMGLKMLSETGILGFLIYYGMMGYIIYMLFKNRENKLNRMALGFIIVLLIYENFETLIIYRKIIKFNFFVLGIILNQFYKKSSRLTSTA